jgi:UPF0716 protein FxsA
VTQGGLVIVGGALLLTPGFVTDIVGLLCLLPPSRAVMSRLIRARLGPGVVLGGGAARAGSSRAGTPRGRVGSDQPAEPGVYDVEVVGIEREPPADRDGG